MTPRWGGQIHDFTLMRGSIDDAETALHEGSGPLAARRPEAEVRFPLLHVDASIRYYLRFRAGFSAWNVRDGRRAVIPCPLSHGQIRGKGGSQALSTPVLKRLAIPFMWVGADSPRTHSESRPPSQ
jgi:hypothetical protein